MPVTPCPRSRKIFPAPHLLSGHTYAGLRVGLLGGSFNPVHKGHLVVAAAAMRRYRLHCVWFMVSPQNPIKSTHGMAPFAERMDGVRAILSNRPFMVACDIETRLGTNRSADTIAELQMRFPKTEFVWICGADNLPSFHRWHRWRDFLSSLPILIYNRPPLQQWVRNSRAQMYTQSRRFTGIMTRMYGPLCSISSTLLRQINSKNR